jgi:hypothetical protein
VSYRCFAAAFAASAYAAMNRPPINIKSHTPGKAAQCDVGGLLELHNTALKLVAAAA